MGLTVETPPPPPELEEDAPEPVSFVDSMKEKIERVRQVRSTSFKDLRPWSEFFDRSAFSYPSRSEAFTRMRHNLPYYWSNYTVCLAGVSIYCLLTNLMFAISMVVCITAWWWFKSRSEPVFIGNTEVSSGQAYPVMAVGTLVIFYLTSGSSTLFWLIFLGFAVVLGHAMHRQVPEQNEQGGLAFGMSLPSAFTLGGAPLT